MGQTRESKKEKENEQWCRRKERGQGKGERGTEWGKGGGREGKKETDSRFFCFFLAVARAPYEEFVAVVGVVVVPCD